MNDGILKKIVIKSGDFFILALSTLVACILAALFMDLLIYPLSRFALEFTALFTLILKYAVLITAGGSLIYLTAKKMIAMVKCGETARALLIYFFKRALYILAIILLFVIISAMVVLAIYFIFDANYTILYKFTK